MFKLEGKAALITGAGKGIGRSIALAYAEQGADVVLLARTESDLESVAAEVSQHGRKAIVIPTDVTDIDAYRAAIDRCIAELGKIDVLVNNAGGGHPGARGTVLDVSEEGWDGTYLLNAKAAFFGLQHAARWMRDHDNGGSIINILSIDGVWRAPQSSIYGSAKAALRSLTAVSAVELGQFKIRVNAIAPGLIDTPLVSRWLPTPEAREWRASFYPLNRVGLPDDIAAAAVFFASDDAEWISGETMVVAGGNPQTSNISLFLHETNPLPDSVRGARP